MIRLARPEDIPAILEIYAPYVRDTAISFEYEVPAPDEFRARFERVAARFPWIVWEEDGRILGYAYGSEAFVRAAYAWDADLSIYLRPDARGRGLGDRLYGCLEELLVRQGYHNLYGIVTEENRRSRRFHARRGYELLGVLKQAGWKLGSWHDVCWYGKRFRAAEAPGGAPEPFAAAPEDLKIMEKYSERD